MSGNMYYPCIYKQPTSLTPGRVSEIEISLVALSSFPSVGKGWNDLVPW